MVAKALLAIPRIKVIDAGRRELTVACFAPSGALAARQTLWVHFDSGAP